MADITSPTQTNASSKVSTAATVASASQAGSQRSRRTLGASDRNDLIDRNVGARPRRAWVLLDEASQELVRAEAIVELLASEIEGSRHQLCAAEIACQFLRTAIDLVAEAREMVLSPESMRGSVVSPATGPAPPRLDGEGEQATVT